jgi:glycerophosphoryl diester phosphodiesterase
MLLISLLLTIIAVILWKDTIHSRLFSVKVAILVFISFFISGFYYVVDNLTGSGIDESVLFHLKAGLGGAGLADFTAVIIYSILYIVTSLIISTFVYAVVRNKYNIQKHKVQVVLASTALFVSFVINPGISDLTSLFKTYWTNQEGKQSVDYLIPENNALNLNKKNLVYIYLESFERTYLDEAIFPGLTPNLKRIESESLTFTKIDQIMGSGWTIAGMVSSQCGIPLISPSEGNSMSGMKRFLPEATCMGDILSASGYELSYIGGASLDFAGKGNFYKTHGFTHVEGLDELKGETTDTSYRSSWGLHDDTLFDILKKRFNELQATRKPFGLFALTLDTHHPNGHITAFCQDVKYKDGSNPILNAVHCADKMVADLYDYITNHQAYPNTVLVIGSDHFAMPNTAQDELKKGDRKNLLLISREGLESKEITKYGASIDVAPTILNLLDADIVGLGFGRDMLGMNDTLLERFTDTRSINNFLASNRKFILSLWDFPQINNSLTVDIAANQVLLDSEPIKYPALILLAGNSRVKEIRFDFNSPTKLNQQVAEQSPEQRFIWIDSCQKMAWLNNKPELALDSDSCVAIGSLDASNISIFELAESMSFSRKQISSIVEHLEGDSSLVASRLSNMEFISKYGLLLHDSFELDRNLTGSFIIKSAGGVGQGNTILENKVANISVNARRGLTLYGVLESGAPTPIRHLDTCGYSLQSLTDHKYSFQDDVSRLGGVFGAFIIVAHDSAICGQADLSSLFTNTGLTKFNNIGYRTPYIAVISGADVVKEFVGDTEQAILIEATDFVRPNLKEVQRLSGWLPSVAHAGGGYKGQTYTNSIDALTFNSNDYELFEIDFSWTSDGHLVCIHDWEHSFKRSFGLEPEGKKSLSEFLQLVRTRSDFNKCTLSSLAEWLKDHPHAKIVTDVKEDNVRALAVIAANYPELQHRFIPQVYQPLEYYEARALGFRDIIWTLYRYGGDDSQVLSYLNQMDLYALTMPRGRADRGLAQNVRNKTGLLSYVHTINSQEELEKYRGLGIAQIYTDFLPHPTPN